ncbi:MAG: DUF6765 family protein [Candidatus Marinimicrobia bacterium]|nr:DUF6765 family protein [Candidatus Neomarinimicrobiota bacterium]
MSLFILSPAGAAGPFRKKWRTFPHSTLLKYLIEDAVNNGNTYFLGIVLHVLADSYSHRGFSGIISRRNRIKSLRVKKESVRGMHERFINTYMMHGDGVISRIFGRVLPSYSHTGAGIIPDISSAEWEYKYDTATSFIGRYRPGGPVSNPDRYRAAFEKIQQILERFAVKHPGICGERPAFRDLGSFHRLLVKPRGLRTAVEEWKRFIEEHHLMEAEDPSMHYDPHTWLREAFQDYNKKKYSRRVITNAAAIPDFIHSDWYAFYRAAGEYRDRQHRLAVFHGIYR